MGTVFGGVEGGGTKFNVLIGTDPDHILDEARFPTTTPHETLGQVIDFFQQPRDGVELAALGAREVQRRARAGALPDR